MPVLPRLLIALVAASVLLPSWYSYATDVEIDKPRRTALSEVSWVPRDAAPQPKVIYGTDDRIDLYQETDPDRRTWAASTCGLFRQSSLVENGDGSVTIQSSAYDVCSDEPFANQPTGAFCSGFMVADDIIVTAGHCFDSGDLNSIRFIFGFVMEDANTPVLTVSEDQVYIGVELLGQALAGNLDYAVVRVDRAITSPDAMAFGIRREGVVSVGANVGVIGHPTGLPLKLAFGANTVVRNNSDSGFFVANLDTYGGNSGSPVIDPITGLVEGILVRGETDFIFDGNCQRSNVVTNTGGRGEDVSKTSTFLQFIPELENSLSFDKAAYPCDGELAVSLVDRAAMGIGTAIIALESSAGDEETLILLEAGTTGVFSGTYAVVAGDFVIDNGTLEVSQDGTITARYPATPGALNPLVAMADIDCAGPMVLNVAPNLIETFSSSIQFETNEPASGRIRFGVTCGDSTGQSTFTLGTEHNVILTGLMPETTYFYVVEATDVAGNETIADNGSECFSFTTASTTSYNTELFLSVAPDIRNTSLSFTPASGGSGFEVCRTTIADVPIDTSVGTGLGLSDDGSVLVELTNGAVFPYLGLDYSQVYVNANGNITFNAGDAESTSSAATHFSIRRIAPLFTDLNPEVGGTVEYLQTNDGLAITWRDVPHFDLAGSNTFQVELNFDGTIRFSYVNLNAEPVVVGLSNGLGTQPDFTSTDFSSQIECGASETVYHTADQSKNGVIELQELMRVIQFVNLGGYHCDAGGEDGYAPGFGLQDCAPHDSDYNSQNWIISLSEVLRLVQFFNAGSYVYDPSAATEDGFRLVVKN